MLKERDGRPEAKSITPRHIDMANEVGQELLNTFSGEEQFEFLQHVRVRLVQHHEDVINSREVALKQASAEYSDLLGENSPSNEGPGNILRG